MDPSASCVWLRAEGGLFTVFYRPERPRRHGRSREHGTAARGPVVIRSATGRTRLHDSIQVPCCTCASDAWHPARAHPDASRSSISEVADEAYRTCAKRSWPARDRPREKAWRAPCPTPAQVRQTGITAPGGRHPRRLCSHPWRQRCAWSRSAHERALARGHASCAWRGEDGRGGRASRILAWADAGQLRRSMSGGSVTGDA
jgi:hypothetical protein